MRTKITLLFNRANNKKTSSPNVDEDVSIYIIGSGVARMN